MSTPEERQWRSYLKAKEILNQRLAMSTRDKEEMFRERARRAFRSMYERYPMIAYVQLKQDDSIYSPELKAHHEKRCEEAKAKMQEMKARYPEMTEKEAKAFEDLKAKYPEMYHDYQELEKQAKIDSELWQKVYQEELENLKTMPIVRKNPFKELFEYIKFKIYVIRHFGLHYKSESIKFDPEDWGKQK
jgi:hypothetical protein